MIARGLFHSIQALSKNGLLALEFETPVNKNDLVRFKDNYGRENRPYEGKNKMKKKLADDFFLKIPKKFGTNKYKFKNLIITVEKHKNAKKLAFLGDMLELGKKSKKFHKRLSVLINRSDIDTVFVYGKYIKETFNSLSENKKGKIFNNLEEAYKHFNKIIHNNDLLMVKGSNATGLNQFSKNIKKGKISAI